MNKAITKRKALYFIVLTFVLAFIGGALMQAIGKHMADYYIGYRHLVGFIVFAAYFTIIGYCIGKE